MNKILSRCAALALALALVLGPGTAGASAAGEGDFSRYPKGVTVEADSASPTGYTATFIYEEQPSYQTGTGKPLGELAKVELYSDCMLLFSYDEIPSGTAISGGSRFMRRPEEFQPGRYPGGGTPSTTYAAEMTEFAEGLWGARVPLTSGAFVYHFRVTDRSGAQAARLEDPNNPALANTATGVHGLASMVYVPYSAGRMGSGPWTDRSLELPLADTSKRGRVETASYTGADNMAHGLAVYLPAGYDARREEPYRVLYLSHGASNAVTGNELSWMNEGAVPNILDNLIAQGRIEPFVVVTMNNQIFCRGAEHQGLDWDFSQIQRDQIHFLMPYVERHYNVSKEPGGRAYAGLSMGGFTASNMLLHCGELFSYYGVWSHANVEALEQPALQAALASLKGKVHVLDAAGSWDWLYEPVISFDRGLAESGIDHSFLEVPGGHDWEAWQQIFAYAAEHFFWKGGGTEDAGARLPDPGPFADPIAWAAAQGGALLRRYL